MKHSKKCSEANAKSLFSDEHHSASIRFEAIVRGCHLKFNHSGKWL